MDDSLPELKLTGIHVEFIWGSKRSNRAGIEGEHETKPPDLSNIDKAARITGANGSVDPFSSKTILLPYRRQWDIATNKVLVNHMLR